MNVSAGVAKQKMKRDEAAASHPVLSPIGRGAVFQEEQLAGLFLSEAVPCGCAGKLAGEIP